MIALYGHPFSSYTWKALIPLYAFDIPFEFRMVDADHPGNARFVDERGGPQGKFPVLAEGDRVVFEATAIIEHLASRHAPAAALVPADADAAVKARMLDRVFDNYVMNITQDIVSEYISKGTPDPQFLAATRGRLERSYGWIEAWLAARPHAETAITLVECAAAPALFYADWVHPIDARWPRLRAWRAHLNALPPIARCIEEARPYRAFFPPGAPDRD